MIKARDFIWVLLVFFLVAGSLTGCGPGKPKADGRDLYTYITQEKDYKQWKMWPGKGALYEGSEPHGMLLTTYVTDNAYSAILGKKGSIPDGGIIVKENYNPEKELVALTVIHKVKGYNAANNDWFWAKYQPDGTIDAEGKVEECINCHSQRRNNDFLFTSDIK